MVNNTRYYIAETAISNNILMSPDIVRNYCIGSIDLLLYCSLENWGKTCRFIPSIYSYGLRGEGAIWLYTENLVEKLILHICYNV